MPLDKTTVTKLVELQTKWLDDAYWNDTQEAYRKMMAKNDALRETLTILGLWEDYRKATTMEVWL